MSSVLTHYCVAGFAFVLQTRESLPAIRSFVPFETGASAQLNFSIVQATEPCSFSEGEQLGAYDWFESVCSFYRVGNKFIWNRVDDLSGELEQISWEGESPSLFQMYCGMREHVIEHLVLIAFNFATLAHRALVLHGSVIAYEGKGYVFLGESGTGKSTHARLWLQHIPHSQILNDDAPVVRIVNDAVMVFGSPWSGKGRVFRNVGIPVNRICRLSQAPYNRLRSLKAHQAFASMVHACLPPLLVMETNADRVFGTLSEIIKRIPLFHLECLPDADAAKVSCDQ